MHEAKTNLSRLIQAALDGEEIIIARGNQPLVRLQVLESAKVGRRLGFADSPIRLAADFDAPLDDFEDYR